MARKPTIAIVGFADGKQIRTIQDRVKDKLKETGFKLEFIPSDKTPGVGMPRLDPCRDFVIVMRWVTHAWYNKAVSYIGRDRSIFLEGGIEKVENQIHAYCSQEVFQAT